MVNNKQSKIPYRQIRASYDDATITVYQAYSAAIAIPAVQNQKLDASPDFLFFRRTWIKPSWCWMMYAIPPNSSVDCLTYVGTAPATLTKTTGNPTS